MVGLDASGFNAKRFDDVLAELQASMRTQFGNNVQLAPETFNGQIVGIFADREASLWELSEAIYHAAYLLSAEGAQLDDKVAEVGITRLPATPSLFNNTVLSDRRVILSGTPGTVVPLGSLFRDPVTLQTWQTSALATIGGGGTIHVEAECTIDGAITGFAGTVTQIVSSVTGWTGVTNPVDAQRGTLVESDAQLRLRYVRVMFLGGGSSGDAMVSSLAKLAGVTSVANYENDTPYTDSEGRPSHSFEVIIEGGADAEIALTIWQTKPDGIQPYGLAPTNAVATTDINGGARAVGFTRPAGVNIYVGVTYSSNADFPLDGQAQMQAAILDRGLSYFGGDDVLGEDFRTNINLRGIVSMTIYVGRSASPIAVAEVISIRERAVFDSTRIAFTKV